MTTPRRSPTAGTRLLVPSSALLWGLQRAFLNPALALILVNLYGATTAEVGWVLAIYNASGFVASLLLPAYADRRHDYLGPMLVCGALTLALGLVLTGVTSLQAATIALVLIGGPAGVGRLDAVRASPPCGRPFSRHREHSRRRVGGLGGRAAAGHA